MVTARVAHHVWIERRQQLDRCCRRLLADPLHVGGQQVGSPALNRDWDKLTPQPGPRGLADPRPVAPPPGKVFLGRGTIGFQVATRDLDEGQIGVDLSPGAQPLLGTDEGHTLATRWAEAEKAAARDGFENHAPTRLHDLTDAPRASLRHS